MNAPRWASSGKVEASHVLSAMGVPEEIAQGAIRVSLGFATKRADIENFLNLMSSSGGSKKYINTTDIQSAVAVVDATIEDDNTYTYNSFETPVRLADAFDSLYRIQLGVRVDF